MIKKQICVFHIILFILYINNNECTALDNSDDQQNGNDNCVVPSNPPHGLYEVGSPAKTEGTYVPQFGALVLNCDKAYNPSPPGKGISVCFKGEWTPRLSTCALSCTPKKSTNTTIVTCSFKGVPIESCEKPVDEVQAVIKCAMLHEESAVVKYPFRICKDGSWDNTFPQCSPICGIKRPKAIINILDTSHLAKFSNYPWHVGIYNAKTKSNICGGTLISSRVVVSAAHCFSNAINGEKYPKENYLVAAGKFYNNYNDERDQNVQYSTIKDIRFPLRYKGEVSQYVADIAVVILTTELTLTMSVQPICVDWANNFEYQQISGNAVGLVIGWGQTPKDANSSVELEELSTSVIPYEQCYEELPESFQRFLTYDKICGKFQENVGSRCLGYSGGGLIFKHTDERYYLRGILSTRSQTGPESCDSNAYVSYTLMSKYVDFVKQLL